MVPHWEAAYVCGIEGIPWYGKVTLSDNQLVVQRGIDESGKLSIAWPVEGTGLRVLQTCSLRQREDPYFLPLELARGTCNNIRTQADNWQRSGMRLPDVYQNSLAEGLRLFLDAAQSYPDITRTTELSNAAIAALHEASDALVDTYTTQALAYRKNNEQQLGTLAAAYVSAPGPMASDLEDRYLEAFNSIAIRTNWTAVETDMGQFDFDRFDGLFDWSHQHGLRVCAGPLFDFQQKQLPHWIYLLEDDFEGLLDSVSRYVATAVQRYRGKVQLWHAVAGLNTSGPIKLDEEQVMRLAVAVIQEIRRCDNRTPILISVDQPWGEYLGKSPDGISPLHFVDALVRSNLGIAGIGLEMRLNYWPDGTLPRSILDVSQQIDRWGLLGLPLLAQISVPAIHQSEPSSQRHALPIPLGPEGRSTSADQLAYASRLTRMLFAKQMVHGIFWESWDDRQPHSMPGAGLIDASGKPRPLLDELGSLRRQYLF
ncbi:MAG: endo-1,4-beta-xylanase [Pirellulaceae bacterium]